MCSIPRRIESCGIEQVDALPFCIIEVVLYYSVKNMSMSNEETISI